jgi:D-alanyl-D-alanine endopeptidase (penicillin-binding protein 7)
MSSENLASAMLAKHYPGGIQGFVYDMNRKARLLGMRNTRFVDSSGLSPRNVSTAADLTKMITAAMQYPIIKKTSTTGRYTANFRSPNYRLGYGNTNPLVNSKRWKVSLSKTGYLREAGRCLVMVAEVDGAQVAMVFLDSLGKRTPLGDAGRVRRWITTGKSGPVPRNALNYERTRRPSRET